MHACKPAQSIGLAVIIQVDLLGQLEQLFRNELSLVAGELQLRPIWQLIVGDPAGVMGPLLQEVV